MATFHFELVSPERIAFAGEVDQVDIPGAEGDFGVFAGHAPLISLLRPGVVTVYKGSDETKLVVLGGLAEVGPKGLTLLADVATSIEEVDRVALQALIAAAEERVKQMEQGSTLDREITRLDHLKLLEQHLEGTAMH